MMRTAFRKVLVLGSGFSKSFCPALPTLKDLDHRLFRRLGADFSLLEQYCADYAAVCNRQPEYLKVEDIATAILGTQVFISDEERLRHEAIRFQLLRFIQLSMRRHHFLEPGASATLGRFLDRCADEGDGGTLLISFNYDLLPEERLRQMEPDSARPFIDYGITLPSADTLTESVIYPQQRSLHLLKLHGSLNWFRLKGAALQYDLRSACLVNENDQAYALFRQDNPIFIPMAHAKDTYLRGSLFSLLWAKAAHYLSMAQEIHFVGYGFPRTDINNLAFLLRHRERIRTAVVYEPDNPVELSRLQRLLGPGIVVSQDAREWVDRQW